MDGSWIGGRMDGGWTEDGRMGGWMVDGGEKPGAITESHSNLRN